MNSMSTCNLQDGLGQLSHALSDLNESHVGVQAQWNDDNRRQFEEEHLRPIAPQIHRLFAATQSLMGTVAKAVRDLEDRGDEA
jgi:hypothetical protein